MKDITTFAFVLCAFLIYLFVLDVLNKTPNDVVYGELGRYPLRISAATRCLKYWFKLLRQPANVYSRKEYSTMLLKMHEGGAVTWVTHVKSILCDNGFEQVWLFGCGNEKYLFRELKERLYSSFGHGWRNHLESSDKIHCTANTIFILKEKHTLICNS